MDTPADKPPRAIAATRPANARPGTSGWLTTSTLRKVPLLTAFFWIIKVMTTAQGEATSDYLVHRLPPVLAVMLGLAGFAIALALQFAVRRYIAWIYWLAVVMVAIFGTMVADVLHIKFHVPYAVSTTLFAIVLALVFVVWYRTEGTLSIHSINTPRREAFYWAAVVAAFALGTAAGDLTATTFRLGYFWSGVMYTGFIAVPAILWRLGWINSILAFWIAYVLTRPLGASYADWLNKPRPLGLGYPDAVVVAVFTLAIVVLVAYLAITKIDVSPEAEAQPEVV